MQALNAAKQPADKQNKSPTAPTLPAQLTNHMQQETIKQQDSDLNSSLSAISSCIPFADKRLVAHSACLSRGGLGFGNNVVV